MRTRTYAGTLVVGLMAAAGCMGYIGDENSSDPSKKSASNPSDASPSDGSDASGACDGAPTTRVTLQRLTLNEYQNSLEDVLGVTLAQRLPESAETVQLDEAYAETLMGVAESAINTMLANTSSPLLACSGGQSLACAQANLRKFAVYAYRRAITSDEGQQLDALLADLQSGGAAFADIVHYGVLALVSSPDFLFRPEAPPAGETGVYALDDDAVGSRLSYFLWKGPPDDALLAAAASHGLGDPKAVEQQARRMLQDPRVTRLADDFGDEWLDYSQVLSSNSVTRDGLTDALRTSMVTETQMFLRSVMTENRSPTTFVQADYTFVDTDLAILYGINGVSGTTFQRVSTVGTPRTAGVLTQATFFTQNAGTSDSDVILRGHALLQNFLCAPPPPPPPNVPALPPAEAGSHETIRQRLADHTKNPVCAGCHTDMDALGFGMENFDQLGRWRTTYADGTAIDASGAIHGQNFDGPAQMYADIATLPDFGRCLTKVVLADAVGRAMTPDDECAVGQVANVANAKASTFADLAVGVVTSAPFRMNRVSDAIGGDQ